MGAAADAGSLDQPYGPTEDAPILAEFVADESAPEIPDTVVRRMELDRIRRVVEALPERARHVVVRRYGLDGREPAKLAELAAELGISRQGVSQLQQRSVRRLKAG
jgi:RNA polymerase primary sigma factor